MFVEDFRQLVTRLNTYYGLEKTVSPSRFDLWFAQVKHIPEAAMSYIAARITAEKDIMPRNLPKVMLDYYGQWGRSSPAAAPARTRCGECGGDGFLWVERPAVVNGVMLTGHDGVIKQQVVFRCGRCDNWQRMCAPDAVQAITREMVHRNGHRVVFPVLEQLEKGARAHG